jgi:hypothetical protein
MNMFTAIISAVALIAKVKRSSILLGLRPSARNDGRVCEQ